MEIDALLARIASQASLNAFIGFDAGATAARWHENKINSSRGPLQGWPLAVKDNIDIGGAVTSAGSAALARSKAKHTASALQRLLDAGTWVVGKTNMHELAFGVTSNNAVFGAVGNPLDPGRSAGGSSGGSASAVAAEFARAALGTDTGGSVRVPASFCGLVGFRPSTGRYPLDGVVPLARSRDTIGLLARDVPDIAALDAVLIGSRGPLEEFDRPLRLGYPRGFLTEALSSEVATAWQSSTAALGAAGHDLIEVDIGNLWSLIDQASPVITGYELRRDFDSQILVRSAGLSRADFVAQIASADVRNIFEAIVLQDRVPAQDAYQDVVARVLVAMKTLVSQCFARHALDAWLFPTTPTSAFLSGQDDQLLVDGNSLPLFRTTVRNLQQASLIGMPSISLPMPIESGSMPCGLCIECLQGADRKLLTVAAIIERVLHAR